MNNVTFTSAKYATLNLTDFFPNTIIIIIVNVLFSYHLFLLSATVSNILVVTYTV